jgi:beta-glucosidase
MGLLGFELVELQPGESRRVTVTVDPRLLARFHGDAYQWRITEGTHQIALGRAAADDLVLTAQATLTGRLFGR